MPYCVRGQIVSRAAGGGIGLGPADNVVLAGGTWPAQARQAAVVLSAAAEQDADESLGQRLLADIRDVAGTFAVSFVASRELVSSLIKLDDAPWRDLEFTARGLSDRLRPYGLTPRRDATGTMRGYRLEDFADAFSRYLPAPVRNRQAVRSGRWPGTTR